MKLKRAFKQRNHLGGLVDVFLNERHYDDHPLDFMDDATDNMVFTDAQVQFPAYVNVYSVTRERDNPKTEYWDNVYKPLYSVEVASPEEAKKAGRELWDRYKGQHDPTALSDPNSKGQIEIQLEQQNAMNVRESFRPFRMASKPRPFQLPQWAKPESSQPSDLPSPSPKTGVKVKDVFYQKLPTRSVKPEKVTPKVA